MNEEILGSEVNKEEMLEELLKEGYSYEEALQKMEEYEEEEEHLAFFRFQELQERYHK